MLVAFCSTERKSMPQHDENAATAVCAAAGWIQTLAPGPLAELRRMEEGKCAPAFWRLVARYPRTIGRDEDEETWVSIIRMVAILTPKGEPTERATLHNRQRRLGTVLCDGGDPSWPSSGRPKPVFSESRLAQLMAARGPQRTVLLERAIRTVARSMVVGSGLNVPDIAYTLLRPTNNRLVAEAYYHRLDRAEQAANESERGTT